jgi:hypothetical protein
VQRVLGQWLAIGATGGEPTPSPSGECGTDPSWPARPPQPGAGPGVSDRGVRRPDGCKVMDSGVPANRKISGPRPEPGPAGRKRAGPYGACGRRRPRTGVRSGIRCSCAPSTLAPRPG